MPSSGGSPSYMPESGLHSPGNRAGRVYRGTGTEKKSCSTGVLCPLVPMQHRRRVFEAIHGLAHPGIRATRRMVTIRFTR